MRLLLAYLALVAAGALRQPRESPRTSLPRRSWSERLAELRAIDGPGVVDRLVRRRVWLCRLAAFLYYARAPAAAVYHDRWTASRVAAPGRHAILDRRRRAQRIAAVTGIGYTPRIVALAGLMLRGFQKSTGLPLEPQIGFGAGANVAAALCHREWLPCLLIGWFAGGPYWASLDVAPPPSYGGAGITIRGVRF